MFDSQYRFHSRFNRRLRKLPNFFLWLFAMLAFCSSPVYATVRNVLSYGAKGDGTTDDTAAINSAIAALQPGDTLLFPCTSSNTYLISSQLTIDVTDVTVDGSSCAIIKDQYSGQSQGEVMVIGGNGNGDPNYGTAAALSSAASELSTSFTTLTSLGVSTGDYVYLCQGGTDGSATPGASCPPSGTNGICDPAGCRGEVLKVASVSGNTVTVTTALHDTYDPVANSAVVQKIDNPLTGITVKNITFDGTGTNTYGLMLAGVAYSTVSGVAAKNVQGAAVLGRGDFNVAWSNITVTGAGSEDCGGAAHFEQQGNLSVDTLSVSQENQQHSEGSGTCYVSGGAFGFELLSSDNSSVANVSVDASGAYGRPFKMTAARWNTLNSVAVQNGSSVDDNGISIEYYSSHNTFNECVSTKNGSSSGAGINLFGNYNQFNLFSDCAVTQNAGVQFVDSDFDRLKQGTDSNNAIVGGTYSGTSSGASVVVLEAPYDSVSGATISGPASSGYSGVEMDAPNGLGAPGAANACINNNVFIPGTPPLTYAITSYFNGGGDTGSGNQLGGLSNNPNGYFTTGTCTAP